MIKHKAFALICMFAGAACSNNPGSGPTLKADVFSWTSSDGFVTGLPSQEAAATVRVKITEPLNRTVIESQSFASADRAADIANIPFGENLRVDMEVLDGAGSIIASGASPMFDFSDEDILRTFRIQTAPVASFAPVGSVVVDRETQERKFSWSRFDYRGAETNWLGRIGHATAQTSDGRILVVGGGNAVPGAAAGALPEFSAVFNGVQIFDPATGYFTDMAFNEETGAAAPDGKDRLFEPVVFHTVTAIGEDRFLVVGGFTPRSAVMRPVNTIQVIDLNAPAGSRVQRLVDAGGSSLVLEKARGWHTATYRSLDQTVVVTGGVGPQGNSDVLQTFELIDLANGAVSDQALDMQEARAQHRAELMADGRTVWLIGGRDADSALATTEVVTLGDGGSSESAPEATMRTPRFGHGMVRMSPGGGQLVLVAGGFTDLDGTVTDEFEISRLGRGSFESGASWTLSQARGGVVAVELPQSQNVIVLGGRGADGKTVATAERLVFDSLTANPPYASEESSAAPTPRYLPSVDILSTGQLLLVGGEGTVEGNEAALDSADFYNPNDPVGGSSTVVVTE